MKYSVFWTSDLTSGFSPGIFEGIVGGRGLGGVCDHINYVGYHIKEIRLEKAWGAAMLKGPRENTEHAIGLLFCRVVKQTLRSAGSNVTENHIEDVSLSALFLMDAAKKADNVLGVSPPTTSHTFSDASSDIKKMVTYLRENKVSHFTENRSSPTFEDPGYKKLCSSWFKETLYRTTVSYTCPDVPDEVMHSSSGERFEREMTEEDIDLDYELFDLI